ncbi:MAG: hypothetical protein C0467_02130 [Planctomycetaceae bacterium]|nr:hypothetical protein [Planctomycetaceae bacterium]
MDPTPAELPPGCLVILIPLSASMADDARVWLGHRSTPDGEPEIRDVPKSLAARFLADELIEALANTLASGYPLPLDVAVLGYGAHADGTLNLISLLAGAKPTNRLVPLADIAALPVEPRGREGDPRKWTERVECAGEAPAAVALAEVYKFVSLWLTGRTTARPPVILHVTDGDRIDEHYHRVARSLGLLTTGYGPARLLHVGFDTTTEPTLCGMWPDAIPELWARLMPVSAMLPAEVEGRPARPAVSVNDWALIDPWSALFDLSWVEDTVRWTDADSDRFEPATARGMWTQKMGNTPEQWEDAYATEPASGVAVVADGASSGIYCRTWADRLARSFITDRPDVRDPIALNKWVHGLRAEWRAAIDYDKLNWSKKAKVDETGAAATFLSLEVGPPDASGNRPWRACAVGDASMFWIRNGRLRATFPVVAADQFGSAPMLIRSNAGYKTLTLSAAGVCRPGDRFLLATDAVAARLFKSAAATDGPDWSRFETIDETAWRDELDVLRKANDMVNDDCTLVTLRVTGGESESAESKPLADVEVSPPTRLEDSPPSPTRGEGTDSTSPLVGEVAAERRVGGEASTNVKADTSPGDAKIMEEPDQNERTTTTDGFSDSTDPHV